MSDFNFLVNEVYTITKRADLVDMTALAVKNATLQLHRQDFFYKDLREVALVFDIEDYLQMIDYRNLFPNYRALKYLRKFYPTESSDRCVGPFYKVKTPLETVDAYGSLESNVVYVAGNIIQVRSSTKEKYALIGLYENPNVANVVSYSSWVADEAPYAIIWKAAAMIQGSSLKDMKAQQASNQQSQLEFAEVANSNRVAEGY